jgi:hypothetical protein
MKVYLLILHPHYLEKWIRKGLWIIWHATIWQARNHFIFRNEATHVEDLLAEIVVNSWRWSLSRINMQTCLFYEWNWNPQECLIRK